MINLGDAPAQSDGGRRTYSHLHMKMNTLFSRLSCALLDIVTLGGSSGTGGHITHFVLSLVLIHGSIAHAEINQFSWVKQCQVTGPTPGVFN